jgi:hypothetical protein
MSPVSEPINLNRKLRLKRVDKRGSLSYIGRGSMEEKDDHSNPIDQEEEKKREIDLNILFPEKGYDLNRLFPDEGTKRLLYELRRNKRDIDRFIKSLHVEEE